MNPQYFLQAKFDIFLEKWPKLGSGDITGEDTDLSFRLINEVARKKDENPRAPVDKSKARRAPEITDPSAPPRKARYARKVEVLKISKAGGA